MKVAVVGATGLVGTMMLKVLEERNFPLTRLLPVASAKSVGREVFFQGKACPVLSMEEAVAEKPDIALFSAGGSVSLEWAPKFAEAGTTVIDNSSAWRRFPNIPLIVPEVNASILKKSDKIIANPNCSTIPLVMVLDSLQKAFGVRRVVVSTYQSVTGSGLKGVMQLQNERAGIEAERAYPHPIDLNVIPQGGVFEADGYTVEESKLIFETRKILSLPELPVTCTVVRVPVYGGHSESVNVEFEKDFEIEEVRTVISATAGTVLQDDPANAVYPMPLFARDKDEVFVGRVRRDFSIPRGINFWVVSDNLRKGAATNAVQIAQYLLENKLV